MILKLYKAYTAEAVDELFNKLTPSRAVAVEEAGKVQDTNTLSGAVSDKTAYYSLFFSSFRFSFNSFPLYSLFIHTLNVVGES